MRGQALVELALILPLMLLLLLGAIDVGRLFYTYVGMQNAAREGATFAMTPTADGSVDLVGITTAARQEMGGDPALGVQAACDTTCRSATTAHGNTITVAVTYTFSFILPVPDWHLATWSTAVIQ